MYNALDVPDSVLDRVRGTDFSKAMLTRGFKLAVFEFSSFTPLPLYCRIDSHQKNHGCEIMLNILE